MTSKRFFSIGFLYALAAAIGLGAITTQAKLVYADGGNATTLMLFRFLTSVTIIGVMIWIKRQSFKVPAGMFLPIGTIDFVWSGAMIAYLFSVQTISVSVAVLILYSYPIVVLMVSIFTGRLRGSLTILILFVLAFMGIVLMLSGGKMVFHIVGIVFAIVASLGAAYTFLAGGHIAPRVNPNTMTFWVNLMGLAMVIPLVFVPLDSFPPVPSQYKIPSSSSGLWALAGATICYVVAILCQFQALAKIPAARAAFILNTEPVVSILLALLVLNESLSIVQWVGVFVIVTVLFVFNRMTAPE